MGKKSVRFCRIAQCENELSEHSRSDICPTCKSSFYYWNRKRPAERIKRRTELAKYGDRLTTMFDDEPPKRK